MSDDGSGFSILVVDDHPIAVSGIRTILSEAISGLLVDTAATVPDGVAKILTVAFDAVLLDLSLGDRSGMEVLTKVRKRGVRVPILVVSMYSEEVFGVRAMKAGASGYLRKDAPADEWILAVKIVLSGRQYISEPFAQILARAGGCGTVARSHDRLSQREFEVLRLIGRGMGTKQIAAHLNLSVKTISTYRTRILRELDLENTADLIRFCIDHRLCDE